MSHIFPKKSRVIIFAASSVFSAIVLFPAAIAWLSRQGVLSIDLWTLVNLFAYSFISIILFLIIEFLYKQEMYAYGHMILWFLTILAPWAIFKGHKIMFYVPYIAKEALLSLVLGVIGYLCIDLHVRYVKKRSTQ